MTCTGVGLAVVFKWNINSPDPMMSDVRRLSLMDTLMQPLTVDGKRVGLVTVMERRPQFNRGTLRLEIERDDPIHVVFDAVVKLASNVDRCSPADYQTAWDSWYRACGDLQDLGLWIGNKGPIEEFTIESNWTVEWTNMDVDDMFL